MGARYVDLSSNLREFFSGNDSAERLVKVEYLILFKTVYISLQFVILYLFWTYNSGTLGANAGGNYEQHKDTVNIYFIVVPTLIAGWIMAEEHTFMERLWTWSEYLEGFCMVPQYIFQYRQSKKENFKGHLGIFI